MVWCVAAPFFIGNISRGRTVRQTILGGYAFGVGSTLVSFIVPGNYSMGMQMTNRADFITLEPFFYCSSGNLIFPDTILPYVFEASPLRKDQLLYKGSHPLDHDYEIMPALVHILYVLSAKISPVQDEPCPLISVPLRLLQHELELGYIHYASRVLFIKKRLLIRCIIGKASLDNISRLAAE